VEDLSKWVLNFENPKVGNSGMIRAFNEPSLLDNGKKVVLRIIGADTIFHAKGQNVSNYKGVTMISHGGHAGAFRTFLGRFPNQRFAIIALSNDEHNESLNARWLIADLYLQEFLKKEADSRTTTSSRATVQDANYQMSLKDFEGEYYNDDVNTTYNFKAHGNKLLMTHLRLSDIELKRVGENEFTGSGPETFPFQMQFLRNETAAVTGFSISNFGVKNLKFIRVK
jgi:hypothetical protein